MGENGASGASAAAPTNEEFVSQANAICKESNNKIAALKAPASNQLSDLATTIQRELPINQAAYDKFSALARPPEIHYGVFTTLLVTGRLQIDRARQFVSAAKANDVNRANRIIAQSKRLSNKFDSLARSMGLTECAKDVGPQG
jgi:hypothetical protein